MAGSARSAASQGVFVIRKSIIWITTGLVFFSTTPAAVTPPDWPLWNRYAQRFLESSGRIIDFDRENSTTSEGQAYALFFALVANDRQHFEQILRWTENNLANGNLSKTLPGWHWGKSREQWTVLDPNSASDADLWMAYTLVQAGRLWHREDFVAAGSRLADLIAAQEVVHLPQFGPFLLPGKDGFLNRGTYSLNPSYLPLQVVLGLSSSFPEGPWGEIAERLPSFLKASARNGFVLDWISYRPEDGFGNQPITIADPAASYDAIRVYLWAGMLAPETPHRQPAVNALLGMRDYLRVHTYPPAVVTGQGVVREPKSSVGFSAAVLPFLHATGDQAVESMNRQRLDQELDAGTGLYGKPPKYYDQNLAMFATGWLEERFHFDERGYLHVKWEQ